MNNLNRFLEKRGEKKFREKQIIDSVYKNPNILTSLCMDFISTISASLGSCFLISCSDSNTNVL